MSASAPSPATSGPSNPSVSSPSSNNGSSSGNSSSPAPQIQPTPSTPPATAPLPTSPPPVQSPPSTNSSSPRPVSPPPTPATSSPPPQSNSPPPASSSPPPASSPPPPASSSPPPASSPPPLAVVSPPPKSPPPPSRNPPPSGSPPPSSSTSPPPLNPSPPPPTEKPSPSPTAPAPSNLKSPPPPSNPQSPSPPAASPPVSPSTPQSPSPPVASPPVSPSTPQSPSPKSSPAPPEVPTPSKTTPSPPAGTTPGSPPTTPSTKTPPSQSLSPAPNSTGTSESDSSTGGSSSTAAIVGITVGVLVVLGVVGVLIWCIRKKKRRDGYVADYYRHPPPGSISRKTDVMYGSHSPDSDQYLSKSSSTPPFPGYGYDNGYKGSVGRSGDFVGDPGQQSTTPGYGNSKPWFSYEELRVATNGFSPENVLGEGGFGCVYKGYLQDGKVVAVKQLKTGSGQGEREFRAEVEIISRVHHRHLVSLVGYCIADIQRLLVYEYVPNGTLEYHLHGNGRPVMDWPTRLRIAVGAARGIAYLHEDCHPRIIHRDIKSANILLDDRFEAQVSDFGLAKLALDACTHVTTRVMGTFGYMAPEYASSGKLTQRSDVFSFGVVLLELVTGRKPVDTSQPLGDESLVEWARPLLSHALGNGDFEALIDPRLENNFDRVEMFRMIEAAAACVRHSAQRRPQMGQVVRALESDTAIEDLNNGVKPGQSTMYNSAQYSADIRRFRRMAFASQEYGSDFSGVSSEYEMTRSTSSSEFHKSKEVEAKHSRHLRVDLDAQSASGSEFPSGESETRPINVSRTHKDETGEKTYEEVPINFRSGPLRGR